MKDVNATQLTAGTRIFYTGDRANMEGVFVVVRQKANDFYGVDFDLREVGDCDGDAPREMNLTRGAFSRGPGCRFFLYETWAAERAAKIAESAANVKRVMAAHA